MIDCITFFDGLDMLEIRLNSLAPYVDRFVICESPYDMVCRKKPLHFDENKDRFKQFNITHLIVDGHEKHMGGWEPFIYQMDYMMKALTDVDPEEPVMISDFDEIPDLTNYQGGEGRFDQRMYYYYLNVFTGDKRWVGTMVQKRKNIKSLYEERSIRKKSPRAGGGWHFSYMISVEQIIDKIEAFCHQEFNTPDIKSKVAERRAKLLDIFPRRGQTTPKQFTIEMPSGPEWLLQNKERYPHLWI